MVIAMSACRQAAPPTDEISLKQASFSELPGWQTDNQSVAWEAFIKTCSALNKPLPSGLKTLVERPANFDMKSVCGRLNKNATSDQVRAFWEENFVPYSVFDAGKAEGLFTGYFEIALKASPYKTAQFPVPIYEKPKDLLVASLGDFDASMQGQAIWGKPDMAKQQFTPYPTRAEIEAGYLSGQGLELYWVESIADKLFLQIQGSGQLTLPDGTVRRVGYAGKNGHPYGSIGKELVARGELTLPQASMSGIRKWMHDNPQKVPDILKANPSYIFFRKIEGDDGPIGAAGVALTPERSLAADLRYIPIGAPVWLSAEHPKQTKRLERMMVVQDTGSAITGPVRGDFFWGSGDGAGDMAGAMRSTGRYYLLLPKTWRVKQPAT